MKVQLETQVSGNYKSIMRNFDKKLFQVLKPKFAKIDIVEFTGSKKGDIVHLQFLKPFKTKWITKITENGENEKESFYVDEGIE